MKILPDTGILGQLCHPNNEVNRAIFEWLVGVLDNCPYRFLE